MTPKTELKEIIENDNIEALKEFLASKKNIDYNYNAKFGDYNIALNPLLYAAKLKKEKVLNYLINNLDSNTLKDFVSTSLHSSTSSVNFLFDKNNLNKIKKVFHHLPAEDRKVLSMTLIELGYEYIKENDLGKMVNKIALFKEILKKDDGHDLFYFLQENPKFDLMDKKNNYLIYALENHAVYCFDIIKDEIKSLKRQQTKSLKP